MTVPFVRYAGDRFTHRNLIEPPVVVPLAACFSFGQDRLGAAFGAASL